MVGRLPDCPRPEHAGSEVVKAGFRGKPPHRRQRFWCRPPGEDPHRFTPLLPRQVGLEGVCLDCERDVATHEGPQVVRTYRFTAREVAEACVSVAGGESYRRAAEAARLVSQRGGRKLNGQLVGNWVELFAGPLWQAHGPDTWPRLLVCDETTFSRRTIVGTGYTSWPRQEAQQLQLPRRDAFTVLGVSGQTDPSAPPRPWFAWAVPGRASAADWVECFQQLGGRPEQIVSDDNPSVFRAAQQVWPLDTITGELPPRAIHCLYHLRQRFPWPAWTSDRDRLTPDRQADLDRLVAAEARCAEDAQAWTDFIAVVRAVAPSARFEKWLRRHRRETAIADQLRRHVRGEPKSNSSVEALVRWLRSKLHSRPFTNRERTNLLLKLLVLDRRQAARVETWAQTIRETAAARGGGPPGPQGACCDPRGRATL